MLAHFLALCNNVLVGGNLHMRLKVTKSKNAASLYVIKSIYNPKTQSNSSMIIEKLGTEAELRNKLNGADPYQWAKGSVPISDKHNSSYNFLKNNFVHLLS
jgi:hypothetical protein